MIFSKELRAIKNFLNSTENYRKFSIHERISLIIVKIAGSTKIDDPIFFACKSGYRDWEILTEKEIYEFVELTSENIEKAEGRLITYDFNCLGGFHPYREKSWTRLLSREMGEFAIVIEQEREKDRYKRIHEKEWVTINAWRESADSVCDLVKEDYDLIPVDNNILYKDLVTRVLDDEIKSLIYFFNDSHDKGRSQTFQVGECYSNNPSKSFVKMTCLDNLYYAVLQWTFLGYKDFPDPCNYENPIILYRGYFSNFLKSLYERHGNGTEARKDLDCLQFYLISQVNNERSLRCQSENITIIQKQDPSGNWILSDVHCSDLET